MATKIRLKRLGGKHDPHFRIVVADSSKKRDGRAVEELGYYCPIGDERTLKVNAERTLHWLGTGAQPTDTVRSLLIKAGVIEKPAGDLTAGPVGVEATDETAAEDTEEAVEVEEPVEEPTEE